MSKTDAAPSEAVARYLAEKGEAAVEEWQAVRGPRTRDAGER